MIMISHLSKLMMTTATMKNAFYALELTKIVVVEKSGFAIKPVKDGLTNGVQMSTKKVGRHTVAILVKRM